MKVAVCNSILLYNFIPSTAGSRSLHDTWRIQKFWTVEGERVNVSAPSYFIANQSINHKIL